MNKKLKQARVSVGVLAAVMLTPGAALAVQPILTQGHVDIGIGYEAGEFDLHVHDEVADQEFGPTDVILGVGSAARTTVPADGRFAFLGLAGSSVWVLPQVEQDNLLFLGLGAEEIEAGVFVGDQVQVTLAGFSGPGQLAVYSTSGVLGNPSVLFNTGDGLGNDATPVPAGGHADYNWAFTAPGDYSVTLQASGTLTAGGGLVQSAPATYRFSVVPEPGPVALAALGLVGFGLRGWFRRPRRAEGMGA